MTNDILKTKAIDVLRSRVLGIIRVCCVFVRSSWDGEKIFVLYHLCAYASAKLFYLFPNIPEEGITGPST
jgi:hypothetical protein